MHTLEDDNRQLETYFNALEREKRVVAGMELRPHLVAFMDLSRSQITDSGLHFISSLKYVKHINLSQCPHVTNSGVSHLAGMYHSFSVHKRKASPWCL